MDQIPRLSRNVYIGLCHNLGTAPEIEMRRGVQDVWEAVQGQRRTVMEEGMDMMYSGSFREGFRLSTSDHDIMMWYTSLKVICDICHANLYSKPQHAVVMLECEEHPPGFTLLRLIIPSYVTYNLCSCVAMNNRTYISSSLFKKVHLRSSLEPSAVIPSIIEHGPCQSYSFRNIIEYDYAFCLHSHHWPKKALPWIQRCRQKGWPSEAVIRDILKDGFHVVPTGSTPCEENEWRISFSQAEQKLVYSMNHCQFLCYGLMKIFLKEVINVKNERPILCSYFMKTILFWMIQNDNTLTWTPENLLSCFWKCFKLLIHWVQTGVCPNFFIPENNMFRVKVTGSMQLSLLCQLRNLYWKGLPCLLLSPTIGSYLSQVILNGILTLRAGCEKFFTLDFQFFREIYPLVVHFSCLKDFAVCMNKIERLIQGSMSMHQMVTLQMMTASVLQETAFYIQNISYPSTSTNKVFYNTEKISLLKLSSKIGYVSDILYLAMYYYRTRRYDQSLKCLHRAQKRMSEPYVSYKYVNLGMYRRALSGVSLSDRMRKAVTHTIILFSSYTYIDELVLEQKINKMSGDSILYIPPLVMLNMLLVLNHHRLGDTVESQRSLGTLTTLLHQADGKYLPPNERDISWVILGICQEVCGNNMGALTSYQYSLQQNPYHYIQKSAMLRSNALFHRMVYPL